MADGNVVANEARQIIRQVQDYVVLDVCMVADGNTVNVAPEHRVAPNAAAIPQAHVAHHHRTLGDIDGFAKGGLLEQEPVELLASASNRDE